MRLVSEITEEERARNHALLSVKWALRELTANLLRVSAGAGRSYQLAHQAQKFVEACVGYHEAAGCLPDPIDLEEVLQTDKSFDWKAQLSEDAAAQLRAEEWIVRGALRKVASELLGQRTQAIAGEHLMLGGVRLLEEARERARVAREAKMKAARSTTRKAKRVKG